MLYLFSAATQDGEIKMYTLSQKRIREILKTFFFCKSFPLQPFFFFFRTDYMIPQTFTVTSSIGCFYFLVFLFYNF